MQRFKNILVVSDPERSSDAIMARAEWLARANGAKLTLLDVIDNQPGDFERLLSILPGARRKELGEQVSEFHRGGLEKIAAPLREAGHDIETVVKQGMGALEIIRHVLAHDNDLVIKAAGQAPITQALGGPDLQLLRKCPCPVWMLNSATEPKGRRIVAAVDPDSENESRNALSHKVMQMATSLARQDEARLDVLNAWYLFEESTLRSNLVNVPEDEIAALLEKAKSESANRLDTLTSAYEEFSDLMRVMHVKGLPSDVISRHAEDEDIDTLVLGTVGRTGLAGLFIGNTAETVLSRVGCSVLAVKPEGFISPVRLEDEDSP